MARLCERAISSGWSVERDVQWQRLDIPSIAPSIRRAMAAIYTDVLYAERMGVEMAERAHCLAPAGTLRRFAEIQVMEEVRHVDFFTRVLDQLGPERKPSPWLEQLWSEVASVEDYDELLVHGQIIERAAGAFIAQNARHARAVQPTRVRIAGSEAADALLEHVVSLVGRDEARHIAFGQLCLASRLKDVPPWKRQCIARRARVSCVLVQRAFEHLRPACARLGLIPNVMLGQLWQSQKQPLQRIGIEIGDVENDVTT